MSYEEKSKFSERLNRALDEAGIPPKGKGRQQTAARMFGVSQRGARKWLECEAIPDTHKIPVIAKRLGVRSEWLLSGTGPMRDPFAGLPDETITLAQVLASAPMDKVKAALVLLGIDLQTTPVLNAREEQADYKPD